MGRADLHVHTSDGDGLDDAATIFDSVATRGAVDVLAITEHDDLATSLRSREVWGRRSRSFDFVTGVEITALEGHVVALYLEEPVPSFRRLEETLERVHAQGGLCFVPHPMSRVTRSINAITLDRLEAVPGGPRFDGIELATSSPFSRLFLPRARELNAARYHLPGVGASDAHFAAAAGTAWTEFDGSSAMELKQALTAGKVGGTAGAFPGLRSAGFFRAAALPLTGLRATPKKMGWRRTAWSFVSRYRLPGQEKAAAATRLDVRR